MSTGKEAAAIDALLTPIARKHMSIATLVTRNSDAFDFYDVSVWGVKHALREAYCAGRAAITGIRSQSASGRYTAYPHHLVRGGVVWRMGPE